MTQMGVSSLVSLAPGMVWKESLVPLWVVISWTGMAWKESLGLPWVAIS
jgi:hypothetical protein